MVITYKAIEHLVAKTGTTGEMLNCEFDDPQNPGIVQSSVSVSSILGVKSRMKTSFIREIKNSAAYYLSDILRRLLGQSIGSSISRVSDQALRSSYYETSLVREDKEKAIVMAFEKVQGQFYFDESIGKFARLK